MELILSFESQGTEYGGGYGMSSFCSLCTSENSLNKLDFQVLSKGIVGTIMISEFCKVLHVMVLVVVFNILKFIILAPVMYDLV